MNVSRRTAIKKTVLGLGTATLGFSTLKGLTLPKEKKLGVALVGLGRYSSLQLGPALKQTKLCQLTGIVTGTPEKAKKWAKEYNLKPQNIYNYDNFDDIKNNPDIDIVYVVLPNAMHAEYTIRAAQAGKHVICEKPMATTAKDCKKMIKACKAAGVKLGIGYRLYYEPHHLEARRLGTTKHYGEVRLMETSLGFSMANPKSWRLDKKLGGGGAIIDLGVYAIQGCRRVIGALPIRVSAKAYTHQTDIFKGIPEAVFWQMEFPNGVITNSSTTYTSYVDRLYASAEKGWFELRPAFNAVGTKGATMDGAMNFEVPAYQQIAQMDAFADSILNDAPLSASGEEGLIDVQIVEAIFKSIKTRKWQDIDW